MRLYNPSGVPIKSVKFAQYYYFNMRFLQILSVVCFALLMLTGSSCKKTQLLTNGGALRFSADTLLFDTVFTSLGSATYKIKIYNEQNQPVTLSSVRLGKGNGSPFKINVNGISGSDVKDQELAPRDSMYVYSTVTIDPNSALSPFIVEDKLIATLNGKEFSVPVVAFGQNARYIVGGKDDSLVTQTWDNVLPYVILNDPNVAKNQTLTINPGCRIYVHPNSRLFIEGTLIINGTKTDSVIFQSDRIDRSYFSYLDLPGEWGGIYFTQDSKNNKLKWTVIKNAGASTILTFTNGNQAYVQPAAIQVDNNPTITQPEDGVQIDNCVIQNSIGYGLLSFGGKVRMRNTLINNCGAQNVGVFQGGNFEFDQCTFVTYGTRFVSHSDAPVMSLLNYLDTSQTGFIPGELTANVRNCIIYGTLKDELICNNKGSGKFLVQFENCLIKAETVNANAFFPGCKFLQDPLFEDTEKWNFRLKSGSPAINAGAAPFYGNNLDDKGGSTNIGAY